MRIKLLQVVMVMLLVLGVAQSALGSVVIYYDQFFGGEVKHKGQAAQDLEAGFIGVGATYGSWKFGAEYGSGEIDSQDLDVSLLSLKAGYRVIDGYASKLDLTLSTLDLEGDNVFELKSNTMLGVDFTQFFSERFFGTATLQYSLNESYTHGGHKYSGSKEIVVPRLKLSYLIADQVGVTAGYSALLYKVDALDIDATLGGYTAGLFYRF